ncbi:MAG: A24 family peptidase [Bacillus sp. (in: Bacteria)]|nr:A24 family peptidase [Bacillus sp. (in: firmicutes)]MCM1426839.1 A24 family peptidase [Eubacterium sp.]
MDFKHDRIDNVWILFGILSGLGFRIQEGGWYGVYGAVISMVIPFALLYPIFKIGALGAGDIKLFMAVGSFLQTESLLYVLICSFIIAALFSLMKMISESNFTKRMHYLFSYLSELFTTREWKLYEEIEAQDAHTYKSNKIHFTLPACISVMLGLGGLF